MTWIEMLTLAIAVIGATLGIFNAYWMIRRDSVRLKVRFVTLFVPGSDIWTTGVEVTNMGYIAVRVTEVGAKQGRFANRRAVITEDFFRQIRLPHHLEPRTSITVAAHPGPPSFGSGFTHCHAATACGIVVQTRIRMRGG